MPILSKTWTQPHTATPFARDGSYTAQTREPAFMLKEALVASGTWSVIASSNRTVADLTDNWTSVSSITKGTNDTNPGSWILLRSVLHVPSDKRYYMYMEYTGGSEYSFIFAFFVDDPDLSDLHPRRPLLLPSAKVYDASPWFIQGSGSGNYMRTLTLQVADDGSWIMTSGGSVSTSNQWIAPAEYSLLFFNFLDGTSPSDPYPFIWFKSGSTTNILNEYTSSSWVGLSLGPDGTQVSCAIPHPGTWIGVYIMNPQDLMCDNILKNNRPFTWEMPVYVSTTGYKSRKGILSDIWWGSHWMPRFGQPAFDGENLAVMQKGVVWIPCVEPFVW